jgi:hypothetical protein
MSALRLRAAQGSAQAKKQDGRSEPGGLLAENREFERLAMFVT